MGFINNTSIPSLNAIQLGKPEFVRISSDALVVDDDFTPTFGGAGQTNVVDAGEYFTSNTVEGVTQEIGKKLKIISSIAEIPEFVGQIAIVGGVAYIAIGKLATSDWKQITA